MARDITSGFESAIEASSVSPILLVKAEFDAGDVLIWSGLGELEYNSETYQGTGNFLQISRVEETQGLKATGVNFSLSGIPAEYVSLALSENYQGRSITVWLGALDGSGALINDPYEIFSGQMDGMEILDDGQDSVIAVRAESDLIDFKESRETRYTPEDQKLSYPADEGLDFVPTIQDIEVVWGS